MVKQGTPVVKKGGRQFSDKKSLSSQFSDKCYNLQISDRKTETMQFSDTHRKEAASYRYCMYICMYIFLPLNYATTHGLVGLQGRVFVFMVAKVEKIVPFRKMPFPKTVSLTAETKGEFICRTTKILISGM